MMDLLVIASLIDRETTYLEAVIDKDENRINLERKFSVPSAEMYVGEISVDYGWLNVRYKDEEMQFGDALDAVLWLTVKENE